MQTVVEYAIVSMSLVALIANLRVLASSGIIKRDLPSLIGVASLVLGGLLYEAGLGLVGQPGQVAVFGLLLGCVILATVGRVREKQRGGAQLSRPLSIGPFFPSAVAVVMATVNAVANVDLPLGQSVGRFLAVAILVLAGLLACVGRIYLEDVGRIIVCSVLIILMLTLFAGPAWRPCDIFKCGPFGAIYTGPFSSENALAIYACVAILFVLKTWSGTVSVLSLLPVLLTLYATESRTSQLAVVLGLAAWAFYLLCLKGTRRTRDFHPDPSRGKRLVFQLTVAAIFCVGFYLVTNAEPAQFSNRGMIWIRGLTALGDDWAAGLGLDRWTYYQSIGLLPPLFPHSEYLLLLFGGGVLSVGFLYAAHYSSIASASRRTADLGVAVSYNVFLAVLGLTEAYWNPVAFDGHTFLVLPLVYLASRAVDPVPSGLSTNRSRKLSLRPE
ncbi:O-antigen ligase family protein [Paenarthrobacter sp. YJN-5]|uniref:O-antigen ligase family protein n=1 Tax=Paenarthrobacter sp. YJN-5 TaxID=2735316 RepID=UPI0018786F15|nr:O-antigen ligase family protein [Paenarthrobacter sp. YJN-5]QOT16036.1 hypothetical protein HMI59_05135 [Paenarthrobacter sp. YJN-5]